MLFGQTGNLLLHSIWAEKWRLFTNNCKHCKLQDQVFTDEDVCKVLRSHVRWTHLFTYFKVFHSVYSCTSNTFSVFQLNAPDILNAYFIKSLLHVSVCYIPSSGRTSYYLLKTICFLQYCCLYYVSYAIEHKIHKTFVDL